MYRFLWTSRYIQSWLNWNIPFNCTYPSVVAIKSLQLYKVSLNKNDLYELISFLVANRQFWRIRFISLWNRQWERPDIISYDPLGRGSGKSIQKFIHRGSTHRNPSRRIDVTVGFTGKYVIQIYSKQAGGVCGQYNIWTLPMVLSVWCDLLLSVLQWQDTWAIWLEWTLDHYDDGYFEVVSS